MCHKVFGRSIDAHWAAIVVVLLRLLGSMVRYITDFMQSQLITIIK